MTLKAIFQVVYIIGLILDVTGACILFRYGISPYTQKIPQQAYITKAGAEYMTTVVAKQERRAKLGLGFIVVGFVFQFIQAVYALFF